MTADKSQDGKDAPERPCAPPTGAVSPDAEWGRVLWDYIRDMIQDAGFVLEIDTDDLMQLAEKHGRAKKVIYDPNVHGEIDAEPGHEIWWWGDDLSPNTQVH